MQLRKILTLLVLPIGLTGPAGAQTAVRAPSVSEARLYARLLAMTDSRTFDRSLIDSVMRSSWAPLRRAGSLATGQVGSTHGMAGAPLMRTLLSDSDPVVASNAAYSLGLLRDSLSVPALSAALASTSSVAREAAWALGEIGAPARAAVVAGLASTGRDDARMIQLLFAAAKLRPVPVAELRPYLAMTGRPHVQWAAAYAIARLRAPAGVRDLIDLASTPEFTRAEGTLAVAAAPVAPVMPIPTAESYVIPEVGRQRARAEIARGLAKSAAGDSLGDAALTVLMKLVADTHPHVRINAVRSIGTYGVKGGRDMVRGARDRDANVRIAAAQSLGTVLDSTTVQWSILWQVDTSLMYRASLLASAARAGARLPALTEWRSHSDWRYRAAALSAAGSSNDPLAVSRAARAMTGDRDGRVRASAFGLLAGNDTTAPSASVRDALVAGLSDRDFYARATILGSLSRHARANDVPAVLSSYARSLADSGNDARIAAIQYLAAAWKKDSVSFAPSLKQQVASLRPSDDPLVRAAAESVSVFSAWPSTSGNPRPLAWYQNIVAVYVVPALQGKTQRATMKTQRGEMVLELFGADAPITVWNFINLARTGYYRGTGFHRVVPNFVAQDGDPRDDGNGGPGYAIRDEMNPRRYERGALGMALSGPDTGGSQYFIAHSPQPHLDGHYTVFGRVLSGFETLDAIVQGDRILSIVTR